MINYYDPNFQGVHVIRVTFMQWDYIGHVAFEIGGNCKGAELMDFTFLECDNQEDIDRYSENDFRLNRCFFSRGWNSVWNRYGIDVFSISVPRESP